MNDRTSALSLMASRLRLGACTLDLAAGELFGPDGRVATLRRQALELLLVLGRRHDQVVTKDELFDAVWPDVVVGETSLAQAVGDVRRALGDDAHTLLRTVARRGYMLVPGPGAAAPAVHGTLRPLTVAVLPFSIDGEPGPWAWVAEALQGDLITELGVPGFAAISRAAVAASAAADADPRAVARALGARHVVVGSLRACGAALRLNIALIDAATGVQRWATAEQRHREGLDTGVAEWACRLRVALAREITRAEAEHDAADGPPQARAEALALRASAITVAAIEREPLLAALGLIDAALALDGSCVRALGMEVWLAHVALERGWLDFGAAVDRIDRATARLEEVDEQRHWVLQSRISQASVHGDWPTQLLLAQRQAQRTLNPRAYMVLGWSYTLNDAPEDALATLQRAVELEPGDGVLRCIEFHRAFAHFMAGRDAEAVEHGARAAAQVLPYPPLHAAALWRLGRTDAARAALAHHRARGSDCTLDAVPRLMRGGMPGMLQARGALVQALGALGMR